MNESLSEFSSAILLAIYLVLVFFSYSASYLATTALSALTPLCSVPFVGSRLPLCELPSEQQPRYPELIDLQTRFEEIMESSATSANLALDMKQSEVAVRDLNTLVWFWFPMLLALASHFLRSNGPVCLVERYYLPH
jgi:hypothetical protein